MRFYTVMAPLALAMAATAMPAQAQWNDTLACMETGYSAEDLATIEQFKRTFDLENGAADERISIVLANRAEACLDGLEWTDKDLEMLLIYRLSALSLEALTSQRPDVAELIRKIDEELEYDKRERLYELVKNGMVGDLSTGEVRELTYQETMFIGITMLSPPIEATEEQAGFIGGFLALKVLAELGASHFRN
jgi:hypothetical protein